MDILSVNQDSELDFLGHHRLHYPTKNTEGSDYSEPSTLGLNY
jgi:hypothetical protein